MLGDETKARNITCQMSDFLKEWVIISWIICFIFISENTYNILFEPSCSCICVLLYILHRWFINSISIPTVMKRFMQRSSKAGRPTPRLFWWSTYHFSYSAGGFRLYSVEISFYFSEFVLRVSFFPAETILRRMHICSLKKSKQIVCLYWLPWQKEANITLLLICIRNLR